MPNTNSGIWPRRAGGNTVIGNVISGNGGLAGVAICGNLTFCGGGVDEVATQQASGNIVQRNLIGTAADGVTPLANGQRGVSVDSAPNTIIGGATAATPNLIAFNRH